MARSLSAIRMANLVGDFDRAPAYRGLRQVVQELIGDGRIPIGTRLPSERSVGAVLGVSRTTVTRAYGELVESGFAQARQGSGTYATVPVDRRRAHDRTLQRAEAAWSDEDVVDLNIAASAATPGVAAAYERALSALPSYLATDGYLPSGLPELQATLAATYADRGLPTDPEQIIVTSGALSAIAVASRALSRPGGRVMVETPVYSNAIEAVRIGGGRLVSCPLADPLGEDGWDLDAVESTLRQTSPHLAYLIPDFQNPTGALMDDEQRRRYGRALRAAHTTAIVDETLQATKLSDTPMPAPFAAYGTDVITIGSASKTFWGGLRVGWIRAPRHLTDRVVAARLGLDLGSSLFDQLVVHELFAAPEVVTRRRDQLRQRRDALASALAEHLPTWCFRLPAGGLTLWVQLPYGSATRLCARLESAGVYLAPGPVFAVEGGSDSWLRLPFTKSEEDLESAVRTLAATWRSTARDTADEGEARRTLIA